MALDLGSVFGDAGLPFTALWRRHPQREPLSPASLLTPAWAPDRCSWAVVGPGNLLIEDGYPRGSSSVAGQGLTSFSSLHPFSSRFQPEGGGSILQHLGQDSLFPLKLGIIQRHLGNIEETEVCLARAKTRSML
jgi:hypothetical protein